MNKLIKTTFALFFMLLVAVSGFSDTAKQVDFLLSGYTHPTTGEPLSGGKVWTFLDGTSTMSALYTDKDQGGTATNPIVLDSSGRAEVYGTTIYKFVIYDSSDVLIETINGLEYYPVADTIGTILTDKVKRLDTLSDLGAYTGQEDTIYIKGRTTTNDGGQGILVLTSGDFTTQLAADTLNGIYLEYSGEDGSTRAWVRQSTDTTNPLWFASNTTPGTTDMTEALQAAINFGLGKKVGIPDGIYLTTDELLVPYNTGNSTHIFGAGRTSTQIKLTGVTNKAVIRLSADQCTIEHLSVWSDSLTNTGIRVAPEDETQTTDRVGQNYNLIQNINTSGTMGWGVALLTGPEIGGPVSSCYHNKIEFCRFTNNTNVGVYLSTVATSGSPSGANRNWIKDCYFTGNMNVGIYNEGGGTSFFIANSFEGVDYGTSPKTTPTAIVIDQVTPISGDDNGQNSIVDCRYEAVTRHIENSNNTTVIHGGNWDRTRCDFTGNEPRFYFGSAGYSVSMTKFMGMRYQTNSQEPGIPNSSPVCDNGIFLGPSETRLATYKEIDFSEDIDFADASRATGEGVTYSFRAATGTLIGNMFHFSIRFRLSSLGTLTTSEAAYIIGMPYTAKNMTNYEASFVIGNGRLLNLAAATDIPVAAMSYNTNYIQLKKWGTATTGPSSMLVSDVSADGDLTISGYYEIE